MPGIMLHFGEIVKKNILGSLFLKHIMKAKNYFIIDEYDAITQTDIVSAEKNVCLFPKTVFYKEFYQQYPTAKFILNYRDISHHVNSICNWKDFKQRLAYFNITNLQEFITQHNNKIRAFYKDKPNFLEFDIENDASEKLSAFLNIPITFPHFNKTKCIS
jgi:hypothetical protein